MPDFGTDRTSILYQTKALQKWFQRSMYVDVTNRDFSMKGREGDKTAKTIKEKFQEFVVTTLTGGGWKSTNGLTPITYTKVKEVISRLVIDKFLEISDEIPSVAAFASAVENPDSEIINQASQSLWEEMDQALLAYYADAASGNWLGTSYATGTVAVTATTGAVVGTGTTFTAGMVGKPFKAAGQEKWYRVKTYTDATHITIENDSDDEASAYDGGTISAGAAYEIQANTVLALTKSNIKYYLDVLESYLDNAKVPNDGQRWIALPAASKPVLKAAPEFNVSIEKVHMDIVEKGEVYKASGFKLYFLPDAFFSGDNTNGFWCVGGHKAFITGNYGFIGRIKTIPAEDNQSGHSDLIKGLFGHGEKVADERRKAGVALFAKFSLS